MSRKTIYYDWRESFIKDSASDQRRKLYGPYLNPRYDLNPAEVALKILDRYNTDGYSARLQHTSQNLEKYRKLKAALAQLAKENLSDREMAQSVHNTLRDSAYKPVNISEGSARSPDELSDYHKLLVDLIFFFEQGGIQVSSTYPLHEDSISTRRYGYLDRLVQRPPNSSTSSSPEVFEAKGPKAKANVTDVLEAPAVPQVESKADEVPKAPEAPTVEAPITPAAEVKAKVPEGSKAPETLQIRAAPSAPFSSYSLTLFSAPPLESRMERVLLKELEAGKGALTEPQHLLNLNLCIKAVKEMKPDTDIKGEKGCKFFDFESYLKANDILRLLDYSKRRFEIDNVLNGPLRDEIQERSGYINSLITVEARKISKQTIEKMISGVLEISTVRSSGYSRWLASKMTGGKVPEFNPTKSNIVRHIDLSIFFKNDHLDKIGAAFLLKFIKDEVPRLAKGDPEKAQVELFTRCLGLGIFKEDAAKLIFDPKVIQKHHLYDDSPRASFN